MTCSRRLSMAVLVLFAAVIFWERAHTREEPIECDTANLSVLAHEWRAGRPLYSDLWINKPPGGILTFAAAEALAGMGSASILLLAVATALATLLGIYAVVFRLTDDRLSALWAAALWTFINGNPYVEANQPMLEGFVNACWCWAAAFALRSDREKTPSWDFYISGSLLALATFYKHHLILPNTLFIVGILAWRQRGRRSVNALMSDAVTLLAPTLLLWSVTFSGYYAIHRFNDIWGALMTRSLEYAQATPFGGGSGLFNNVLSSLKPSVLIDGFRKSIFYSVLPLAGLSLPGFFLCHSWKDGRRLVLGGYLICAWVGMALPGRFYAHYYQLLLPPFMITAGVSIHALNRHGFTPRWRRLSLAWVCLFTVLIAYREVGFYKLPADDWSRLKYGEAYIAVKRMGETINLNLLPRETFYEIGYEPGLYYYSRRSPPTGMLFADDWETGPASEGCMQKIQRDLERRTPELFITTRFWLASPLHSRLPLLVWCLERFRPFPPQLRYGPFLLYARKGGRLDKVLPGLRYPSPT